MTDLAALGHALRDLLGPGIGVGIADPAAPGGVLWPEEEPAMARAVDKRRREFAAGRTAARAAMADLGLPPAPVPMAPDRAPLWPPGLTGSIAHCRTAAIAAVAHADTARSIGLDIEEATPLETELWDLVLTPGERSWLAIQPAAARGLLAKRIFSAKEALYKAQYPLTGAMIDFQEVEIEPEAQGFRSTLSGQPVRGRTGLTDGLILSLLTLPL